MLFGFFWGDWTLLVLLPAMIFAIYAQAKVKSTFEANAKVTNRRGLKGAQAARQVLDANGNWVTDPDHVTLIFTVTTTTPTAEVMTTKVGDQEVRIGKTDYILKSEYIEFSDGTITNVIWGD